MATRPLAASRRRRPRLALTGWLIALLLVAIAGKPVFFAAARWVYPYPYRDLIEAEAERYQLDPLLVVAVMRTESGFSPEVRSRAGARGLMQLMPATAAWAARRIPIEGYRVDQLARPAVNIRIGCWYLSYLHRQFPGDLSAVLAAYNAGEGNVARWKKAPDEIEQTFPETRRYVARGLSAYRIYRLLYRKST